MIRESVDPALPVFMDCWECAILDLWDRYTPVYFHQDISSFWGSAPNGAYVVATRSAESGQYRTDYPDKPFLRDIPSSWIKVNERRLGFWQYFKPGLTPVLFYVPPCDD